MGGTQPWNQWDWDYLWHVLGGVGINGAVVALAIFTSVPWGVAFWTVTVVAWGGVMREGAQHDWDPLTAHQWLEGLAWGLGALVVALAGIPFYG